MYTAWSSFSSVNRISLLPICCMSWMLHTYFVSCLSLLCCILSEQIFVVVILNMSYPLHIFLLSVPYFSKCSKRGRNVCVLFGCLFLGGVTMHLDFGIKIVLLWLIVLWAKMIKFVVFGLSIKSMLLFSCYLIWQCCLYFGIPISPILICCILLWYHII